MNNEIAAGGLNNLNHIQRELTEIDTGADAERRIHFDEFSSQLNEWSRNGSISEYRFEAARRIQHCFTNRTGELNVAQLKLRDLPDCIRYLNYLRTLDLNGNRLESLPDCVHALRDLNHLNLDGNRLTSLPDNFWKNKVALHDLSLQHNRLTSFPAPCGRLLATNFVGGNQIFGIDLAEQPRVHRIDLAGNNLTSLPENIYLLRGLRILNLRNNELTELPRSIWNLSGLNHLDLSYNELDHITEPQPAMLTEHMYRNHGHVLIDQTMANMVNHSIFRLVPVVIVQD